MSVKSHVIFAVAAVKATVYVGKTIMDSDMEIAREAQRRVFEAFPQHRLLRYAELITAELEKRRGAGSV